MFCPECQTGQLALVKSQHAYYEIKDTGHPKRTPSLTKEQLNVECLNCGAIYEFEQDYNERVVFVKRGNHRVYSGELI